MTISRRTLMSLAMGAALPAARTYAQTGAAPLSIVIPFAPGGASDLVVRILADGLARELNRTVIAENKGGAGGLIAAAAVGRSGTDGRTLLYGNQGQMVVARHLFPSAALDPRSVLEPMTLTARTQFLLVVPPDSSATRATALAEAGRRDRLKFGIPGIGSPPHLAAILFGERSGALIDVIPYQGSAPMLVDLMAGRLDAAFDNVASSLTNVRAGKLRALGVSGMTRASVAAEIPTLAEAGIDGYDFQSWQGLFAPKGTSADWIGNVVASVNRILAEPAARKRLTDAGLEPAVGSAAEFEALIARDAEAWDARVRKGLIRAG
jgi:tripartite-type tricarboxylate transporter receptor subunit TctC